MLQKYQKAEELIYPKHTFESLLKMEHKDYPHAEAWAAMHITSAVPVFSGVSKGCMSQ